MTDQHFTSGPDSHGARRDDGTILAPSDTGRYLRVHETGQGAAGNPIMNETFVAIATSSLARMENAWHNLWQDRGILKAQEAGQSFKSAESGHSVPGCPATVLEMTH